MDATFRVPGAGCRAGRVPPLIGTGQGMRFKPQSCRDQTHSTKASPPYVRAGDGSSNTTVLVSIYGSCYTLGRRMSHPDRGRTDSLAQVYQTDEHIGSSMDMVCATPPSGTRMHIVSWLRLGSPCTTTTPGTATMAVPVGAAEIPRRWSALHVPQVRDRFP